MTLRIVTSDVVVFGTSMPRIGLPGTGASMRIEGAASASARSFARVVIWFTRTRVSRNRLRSRLRLAVLVDDRSPVARRATGRCVS